MEEKEQIKVEDIRAEAETKTCPVQKALYYINGFLTGPMCGKCFPCSIGSYETRIILNNIIDGKGSEKDLFHLKKIAEEMLISSRCKKGKDTAQFILEWMGTGVFRNHITGNCPDMSCPALVEYRVIPGKCTMCGLCKDMCHYGAIHGEKIKPYFSGYLPYEIRQKKCVKCGECQKVCPAGAIVVANMKDREPVGV